MSTNKYSTTCHYWKTQGLTCFAGKNCLYLHNYVCRHDGFCKAPKCNYAHFKQSRKTFLKESSLQRNRSPQRYSRSPRRYSRSPRRYSRSPRRHSRSPKRYSRSPRRHSKSPRRFSRSPRRCSRSPRRRGRSYSRSPGRHSRSPRSYSRSPRKSDKTPARHRGDSYGHGSSRHTNDSRSSSGSKSPQAPNAPPAFGSFDPSDLHQYGENMKSEADAETLPPAYGNINNRLPIKLNLAHGYNKPFSVENFGFTNSTASQEDGLSLPEEKSSEIRDVQDPVAKELFSSLSHHKKKVPDRRDASLSPSSRALEIIKCLPKDFFNFEFKKGGAEGRSAKSPILIDSPPAPGGTSQRANSSKAQSGPVDPFKEALLKVLGKTDSSGPKDSREADADTLPSVKRYPIEPPQERAYPPEKSPPSFTSSLWTPAMDRVKPLKPPAPPKISVWEIDTPYVSRKDRNADPHASSEKEKTEKPPRLPEESFSHVPHAQVPVPLPPKISAPYPTSLQGQPPKVKRKPQYSSPSSSSSSPSSSEEEEKKPEDKSGLSSPAKDSILEQKKVILSRVWKLMEQKKKLDAQRDNIAVTHKHNPKTSSSLLAEIDNLRKEVDRKIFLMNKSIKEMNANLGLGGVESGQESFAPAILPFVSPNVPHQGKSVPDEVSRKEKKPPLVGRKKSKSRSPSRSSDPKAKKKARRRSPSPRDRRSKSREKRKSDSRERSKSRERMHKQAQRSKSKDRDGKEGPSRHKGSKGTVSYPEVSSTKERTGKSNSKGKNESDGRSRKPIKRENGKGVPSETEEYAPSPALKPHIKYIDQGFHWCKLCNTFSDSVSEFIQHLSGSSHIQRLKKSDKSWLPKPVKQEKKEPIQAGAPTLTIPLQGMEFMHSIPTFYCSLCSTFIYTEEEASSHCETNLHVSRYKEYLAKNPMYESSYNKNKMAAFAEYTVAKEKYKLTKPQNEPDTPETPTAPARTPPDKEDSNPFTNTSISDWAAEAFNTAQAAAAEASAAASSIRVVSRSAAPQPPKEDWVPKDVNAKKKHKSKNGLEEPATNGMEIDGAVAQTTTDDAIEEAEVDGAEAKASDANTQGVPLEEKKLQALKKKLSTEDPKDASPPVSSSEREEAQKPEAKATKLYGNVLIGKMPFLTRRAFSSKNQNAEREAEARRKKESKIMERRESIEGKEMDVYNELRQKIMGEGDKNDRKSDSAQHSFSLPQVLPDFKERPSTETTLPMDVPKGVEYIAEIMSSGNSTQFTKVIGPTLSSESDQNPDGGGKAETANPNGKEQQKQPPLPTNSAPAKPSYTQDFTNPPPFSQAPPPMPLGPPPIRMGPPHMAPGPYTRNPSGPGIMGPCTMDPGPPCSMDPGPMGPGPPGLMGPGPPCSMGPGPPCSMGPGPGPPCSMGPGPMGPGPPPPMGPGPFPMDHCHPMGPGPFPMGPGPFPMGPGPMGPGQFPMSSGPFPMDQSGPCFNQMGPSGLNQMKKKASKHSSANSKMDMMPLPPPATKGVGSVELPSWHLKADIRSSTAMESEAPTASKIAPPGTEEPNLDVPDHTSHPSDVKEEVSPDKEGEETQAAPTEILVSAPTEVQTPAPMGPEEGSEEPAEDYGLSQEALMALEEADSQAQEGLDLLDFADET